MRAANLRQAGISRRPRAHFDHPATSAASRRSASSATASASSPSTTRAAGCAGASTTQAIRPVGLADVEIAPILGADGKPHDPRGAKSNRRAATTTRSRSPRRAAPSGSATSATIRFSASITPSRAAGARAADPHAGGDASGMPSQQGHRGAGRGAGRDAARRHVDRAVREGAGRRRQHQGFLIGGPSPGNLRGQAHRRVRHHGRGGDAEGRPADPGACVLDSARRRHAHPPRAARQRQAGRRARRRSADRGGLRLPDRQHGRPVGARRPARRNRADDDLGRQFLRPGSGRCCCNSRWRIRAAAFGPAGASEVRNCGFRAREVCWESPRIRRGSLPPCGGGVGRGVVARCERLATTPLSVSPPQGGRER